MNLDEDTFIVTDGVVERVRLGKQTDGSYGLLIKDENDNILMQITGTKNLLQSPSTNLSIDFNEEQLLIKNDGGTPIILLGKQVNGF